MTNELENVSKSIPGEWLFFGIFALAIIAAVMIIFFEKSGKLKK